MNSRATSRAKRELENLESGTKLKDQFHLITYHTHQVKPSGPSMRWRNAVISEHPAKWLWRANQKSAIRYTLIWAEKIDEPMYRLLQESENFDVEETFARKKQTERQERYSRDREWASSRGIPNGSRNPHQK